MKIDTTKINYNTISTPKQVEEKDFIELSSKKTEKMGEEINKDIEVKKETSNKIKSYIGSFLDVYA